MTRPNLVLIVLDTARADEVFSRGPDGPAMPTLRSLAEAGTRFTDATANAPWTLPSHATLFTGETPTVHGAHAAHKYFDYSPTLAEQLDQAGYHTIAVSNNTWISGEFGFDRGFAEFLTTWRLFQDTVDFSSVARKHNGLLSQLRGVASEFRGNPVKNVLNLLYGKFFRKRRDDGAARTNRLITDRIEDWLAGPEPLFLFVNYLEPHLEYRPPRSYATAWLPDDISYDEAMAVNQDAWACITGIVEMSDRDFRALRALYRAELAYLDDQLADLLSTFTEAGAREETVFVVTGDHGEHIGEYGLMDHQYSLSRELLSVPLVVDGPRFSGGGEVSSPVQLADVPATMLDLASVGGYDRSADGDPDEATSPLDTALDPRSLVDPSTLPNRRPLYAEYLAPQPPLESLRERYDPPRDISQYDRRLRAGRLGGAKLVAASDGTDSVINREAGDDVDTTLGAPQTGTADATVDPAVTAELRARLESWVDTLPSVADEDTEMDAAARARLEDLGYLQ